jgi:hypothetical protein
MLYWLTKPFKQKYVSYKGFLQSSISGKLYPAEMRYYPSGLTVVIDHYECVFHLLPVSGGGYVIENNNEYSKFFLAESK